MYTMDQKQDQKHQKAASRKGYSFHSIKLQIPKIVKLRKYSN